MRSPVRFESERRNSVWSVHRPPFGEDENWTVDPYQGDVGLAKRSAFQWWKLDFIQVVWNEGKRDSEDFFLRFEESKFRGGLRQIPDSCQSRLQG